MRRKDKWINEPWFNGSRGQIEKIKEDYRTRAEELIWDSLTGDWQCDYLMRIKRCNLLQFSESRSFMICALKEPLCCRRYFAEFCATFFADTNYLFFERVKIDMYGVLDSKLKTNAKFKSTCVMECELGGHENNLLAVAEITLSSLRPDETTLADWLDQVTRTNSFECAGRYSSLKMLVKKLMKLETILAMLVQKHTHAEQSADQKLRGVVVHLASPRPPTSNMLDKILRVNEKTKELFSYLRFLYDAGQLCVVQASVTRPKLAVTSVPEPFSISEAQIIKYSFNL